MEFRTRAQRPMCKTQAPDQVYRAGRPWHKSRLRQRCAPGLPAPARAEIGEFETFDVAMKIVDNRNLAAFGCQVRGKVRRSAASPRATRRGRYARVEFPCFSFSFSFGLRLRSSPAHPRLCAL